MVTEWKKMRFEDKINPKLKIYYDKNGKPYVKLQDVLNL